MIKLFCLFMWLTGTAAGQANTPVTDKKIAAIKKYVATVDSDTTLLKFSLGTPANSGKTIAPLINRDTVGYLKNNSIKKISVSASGTISIDQSLKQYYFKDNKLVYIYENYSNSSRMGACGTIVFTNTFFFDNGKLIGYKIIQTPDGGPFSGCYPVTIAAPVILMQVSALLQRLQQVYDSSSR